MTFLPQYAKKDLFTVMPKRACSLSYQNDMFTIMLKWYVQKGTFTVMPKGHFHYHAKRALSLLCQKGTFTVMPKGHFHCYAKRALSLLCQKATFTVMPKGYFHCHAKREFFVIHRPNFTLITIMKLSLRGLRSLTHVTCDQKRLSQSEGSLYWLSLYWIKNIQMSLHSGINYTNH